MTQTPLKRKQKNMCQLVSTPSEEKKITLVAYYTQHYSIDLGSHPMFILQISLNPYTERINLVRNRSRKQGSLSYSEHLKTSLLPSAPKCSFKKRLNPFPKMDISYVQLVNNMKVKRTFEWMMCLNWILLLGC